MNFDYLFFKCEVIGDRTHDLTKLKFQKKYCDKNARKNRCGEWGLNRQPLEWMIELGEK